MTGAKTKGWIPAIQRTEDRGQRTEKGKGKGKNNGSPPARE